MHWYKIDELEDTFREISAQEAQDWGDRFHWVHVLKSPNSLEVVYPLVFTLLIPEKLAIPNWFGDMIEEQFIMFFKEEDMRALEEAQSIEDIFELDIVKDKGFKSFDSWKKESEDKGIKFLGWGLIRLTKRSTIIP